MTALDIDYVELPIPEGAKKLQRILVDFDPKTQVYVVGGAVRDYYYSIFHGNGKYDPKDVDLTTNISELSLLSILGSKLCPKEGVRVYEKQSVDTFGVVFVNVDGEDFEIAPFRKDVGGDGRRPDRTEFGTFEEDAARRDFTINSLYYDIKHKMVLDVNGGIEDIKNRKIRTVGDPFARFDEDKLRILRMVRFFSRFNPGDIMKDLDDRTIQAVKKFVDIRKYAGISSERIVMEFVSGLKQCIDPAMYLSNYKALGLMESVLPGKKAEIANIKSRNPKVVLAALLLDEEKPGKLLNELKYSLDVTRNVQFLRDACHFDPQNAAGILKDRAFRFAFIENTEDLRDMAEVVESEERRTILRHLADTTPFWPPAEPLLAEGLTGAEIGKRQREYVQRYYETSFQNYTKG